MLEPGAVAPAMRWCCILAAVGAACHAPLLMGWGMIEVVDRILTHALAGCSQTAVDDGDGSTCQPPHSTEGN